MMNHLESNSILVDCQHGFRQERSCETHVQLVTFINELLEAMNNGIETDVIAMDLSKAFDTVPHKRLMEKLKFYGINAQLLEWIENFLCYRKQRVIVDGQSSEFANVISEVPQGTVLGPILFLIYINDLPDNLESPVRLYVDDCILYRPLVSTEDTAVLQRNLMCLSNWYGK